LTNPTKNHQAPPPPPPPKNSSLKKTKYESNAVRTQPAREPMHPNVPIWRKQHRRIGASGPVHRARRKPCRSEAITAKKGQPQQCVYGCQATGRDSYMVRLRQTAVLGNIDRGGGLIKLVVLERVETRRKKGTKTGGKKSADSSPPITVSDCVQGLVKRAGTRLGGQRVARARKVHRDRRRRVKKGPVNGRRSFPSALSCSLANCDYQVRSGTEKDVSNRKGKESLAKPRAEGNEGSRSKGTHQPHCHRMRPIGRDGQQTVAKGAKGAREGRNLTGGLKKRTVRRTKPGGTVGIALRNRSNRKVRDS